MKIWSASSENNLSSSSTGPSAGVFGRRDERWDANVNASEVWGLEFIGGDLLCNVTNAHYGIEEIDKAYKQLSVLILRVMIRKRMRV